MQIRINAYDRAPHENMTLSNQLKFYNYYPRLIKMSKEDSLMKKISLQPGTVLLVNNWRILHGRTAFEGQRTLSGCYIGHMDFMSRCRSLDIPVRDIFL